MVSSVTGFLDFASYMAASFASKVFAYVATTIGWVWLILIWAALMVVGFFISVPYGDIIKRKKEKQN
jgi:sugar phosphate permease